MARKKSINDLIRQYKKIETYYGQPAVNTRTGEYEMHPRVKKARSVLSRYVQNIDRTPSGRKNIEASNNAFYNSTDNDEPRRITEGFRNRKFSRSTYMGLSVG